MIAVVDNTSNAIEGAIGEMINEPMILKRSVKELDDKVGHDRLIEEQDLPRLRSTSS